MTLAIGACRGEPTAALADSGTDATACAGAECQTTGAFATSSEGDAATAGSHGTFDSSSTSATGGEASGGSMTVGTGSSGDATTRGGWTSSGADMSSSDVTTSGVTSSAAPSSTSTSGTDDIGDTGFSSTGVAGSTDASGSSDTGGPVDIAGLSDEFDDASTFADWILLDQVLGVEAPYDILDIDMTAPGRLAVTPRVSVWYMDEIATFIYKEVAGDFLVEVDVGAYMLDTQNPPNALYNSAGIMLRDPASVPGDQNWIEYNIGYQLEFVGLEGKATSASVSELILLETVGSTARLRICRLGSEVRMLSWTPADPAWIETHVYPDSFVATPGLVVPETVQVGMVANAYVVADMHAEFEYVRLRAVSDETDCAAP